MKKNKKTLISVEINDDFFSHCEPIGVEVGSKQALDIIGDAVVTSMGMRKKSP